MAITGKIAASARSELPSTWDKLADESGFGEPALALRLNSVMKTLFDSVLSEEEQDDLDELVVEYAGKRVALKLIVPGIDFWSKQPNAQVATGRSENKTWGNRAVDLKDLQKQLLAETTDMWPDVVGLLPLRRRRAGAPVPAVRDMTEAGHLTPNPDDVEPPFAPFRGSPDTGLR